MKKRPPRKPLASRLESRRPNTMTIRLNGDNIANAMHESLPTEAQQYLTLLSVLATRPGPHPCPGCSSRPSLSCPLCGGARHGIHVQMTADGKVLTPEDWAALMQMVHQLQPAELDAWIETGELPVQPAKLSGRTY